MGQESWVGRRLCSPFKMGDDWKIMSRHIVRTLAGWELDLRGGWVDADRCRIVSTDLRSSVMIVDMISWVHPQDGGPFRSWPGLQDRQDYCLLISGSVGVG
jgi:hypothetical protein